MHYRHCLPAAFLLIVLSFVCACKQTDSIQSADYYAVRKDQVLALPTGIELVADSLAVSICPEKTICFFADQAFVSLRVSKGMQTKRLRLLAYPGRAAYKEDSSGVDFGDSRYKVILRAFRYIHGFTGEVTVQVSKL